MFVSALLPDDGQDAVWAKGASEDSGYRDGRTGVEPLVFEIVTRSSAPASGVVAIVVVNLHHREIEICLGRSKCQCSIELCHWLPFVLRSLPLNIAKARAETGQFQWKSVTTVAPQPPASAGASAKCSTNSVRARTLRTIPRCTPMPRP